ncbi:MAG: hypothetical protein ACYCW6_19090 [Candidatus Xenobia bacterium]
MPFHLLASPARPAWSPGGKDAVVMGDACYSLLMPEEQLGARTAVLVDSQTSYVHRVEYTERRSQSRVSADYQDFYNIGLVLGILPYGKGELMICQYRIYEALQKPPVEEAFRSWMLDLVDLLQARSDVAASRPPA